MIRTVTYVVLLLVLAAGLSSCTVPVSSARLQFALSESGTIGYEVDDSGVITVKGRNMHFRNAAGAYGVTITEYRISYFDQNGSPLDFGGSMQAGSVNLYVPPGIRCTEPDPVYGCQLGDDGWYFAAGYEIVSVQSYQLMPVGLAIKHIESEYPIGWYAEIVFDGFDTLGRAFTTDAYLLAITAPD